MSLDETAARRMLEGIVARLESMLGTDVSYSDLAAWGDEGERRLIEMGRTGRAHLTSALLNARRALGSDGDLEKALLYCLSLERQGLAMERHHAAPDRQRGAKVRAAASAGGSRRAQMSGWKHRAAELQSAIDEMHRSNPGLSFDRLCTLVAVQKVCSTKTLKRHTHSPK